jgi:RHS repeat-associated protein
MLWNTDPDRGRRDYVYDGEGRVSQETAPGGLVTTFTYDKLGRKRTRTLNSGTPEAELCEWRYDGAVGDTIDLFKRFGRTESDHCSGRDVQRYYFYDVFGNVTRTHWNHRGVDYARTWKFDSTGRYLLGFGMPDGSFVGDNPSTTNAESAIGYGEGGQVIAIPNFINKVTYTASGEVEDQANANDTTTHFDFHPQRLWLTGIKTLAGQSSVLQDLTFSRDAQGKVTERQSAHCGDGWSYAYDEMNRLTAALNHGHPENNEIFDYNSIGNLIWSSKQGYYEYPPAGGVRPHAVTKNRGRSYGYDDRGNMTQRDGMQIVYNGADQPVIMTGKYLTYTADGERFREETPGGARLFFGDDVELDLETGAVTTYIKMGSRLVAKVDDGIRYWLHTDQLGSVNVVTRVGQVSRRTFAPYGAMSQQDHQYEEPRGFTGERMDHAGLVYLGARLYDTSLGRMISPDPTVPGSRIVALNRYAYVFNDPLNYVDPSGYNPLGPLTENAARSEMTSDQVEDLNQWQADHDPETLLTAIGIYVGLEVTVAVLGAAIAGAGIAAEAGVATAGAGAAAEAGVATAGAGAAAAAGATADAGVATAGAGVATAAAGAAAEAGAAAASGAAAVAGVAPKAADLLTMAQRARFDKIGEIAHNWSIRQTLSGNLLDPGHVTKIREGLVGLTRSRDALINSLRNPNLNAEVKLLLQQSIDTANDLITRGSSLIDGL